VTLSPPRPHFKTLRLVLAIATALGAGAGAGVATAQAAELTPVAPNRGGLSTVNTRLGPLTLENGYPTKATSAKLYDEIDFQRATQAYLWALPAIGFKALYDAQRRSLGTANGEVLLYQNLKDKAGMLTHNITTLYAFSFWDLASQGPLVVEVPAGLTAGGVMDIWQQPITDMGQTGPDKGLGGKYLILPPGSPAHDVRDAGALGPGARATFQARCPPKPHPGGRRPGGRTDGPHGGL